VWTRRSAEQRTLGIFKTQKEGEEKTTGCAVALAEKLQAEYIKQ
jgi:hypothetical protein